MGKPERKIRERVGSSSSYVLRCFGISRKIHSDKPMAETVQETKKKKTRSRWFSRPIKFRLKNGDFTTAPIHETEEQTSNVEDDKQKLLRVIPHDTDCKNIAASGYYNAVEHETKEKNMTEQRDINPDPLSYLGYDTCLYGSTTTACGGKPDQTKTAGSGSKVKSSRVRKGLRVRRFDPVIGISIVMVTLIIMLTWGRFCAIVCTSTWCYFLPRLKEVATAAAAAEKRKRSGGGKAASDLDLNSEAYKKKVVMEGFLFRQHRVPL